ncbi:DUF6262 family protein [Kitasatospora sp. NPDC058965]|uniref:DUF6262 family protein n=1 Tax=Kitasatospora sp. NPDC058965 TaxID=3346682 RepID=UPI00368A9B36
MSDLPDPASQNSSTRRIEALKKAAQNKRKAATDRAEAGIRSLLKDGTEINFRSVSRSAGVSLDFLYDHPDLRLRIETLRGQQQRATARPPADTTPNSNGTVIQTLTEALRRERGTRRDQVRDLEQRLAAAHGEILRLQRRLREHGLADR